MARAGRALLCALLFVGCTSLRDDLRRAENAYSDARYEDAQRWIDALERDAITLAPEDRAKYFYVAGMTHLRLGDDARARHELALCAAEAEMSPGVLGDNAEQQLKRTLIELSRK